MNGKDAVVAGNGARNGRSLAKVDGTKGLEGRKEESDVGGGKRRRKGSQDFQRQYINAEHFRASN
jgi:hypothetical protein